MVKATDLVEELVNLIAKYGDANVVIGSESKEINRIEASYEASLVSAGEETSRRIFRVIPQ